MSSTCKTYAVPGAKGDPGPPGSNGTNGVNAFTAITTGFAMPIAGNTVVAAVADSSWATIGQYVYISACGTMQVTGKPTATSLTLLNPATGGLYSGNVSSGTTVAAGNTVSPAGQQGPAGSAAAGGLLAANNLSDVANVATARSNLGVGNAGEQSISYFLQTSLNLSDVPDEAVARGNLGLGSMSVQDDNAVNITGGEAQLEEFTVSGVSDVNISSTLGTKFRSVGCDLKQTVLDASTQLDGRYQFHYIRGNGAAVTLTATPTISVPSLYWDSTTAKIIVLWGISATFTVTLQDESVLAGSRLRLGAATRVISDKQSIVLLCHPNISTFFELSYITRP